MDLIDRDKALAETWKEPNYTDPMNVLTEIRDRLKALPFIQIIHCKECLHKIKNGNHYECNYWDFEDPKDDGFCSFAERRTDVPK